MIKARLTKSAMEREDGLNHLWIELCDCRYATEVRLRLDVPPGIQRLPNWNGLPETADGDISIRNPAAVRDVFVELYTDEATPAACGEYRITVTAIATAGDGERARHEIAVPIAIVSEDEAADIVTDEEAAERVKSLPRASTQEETYEFVVHSPARSIPLDPYACSPLEKKYRVDY